MWPNNSVCTELSDISVQWDIMLASVKATNSEFCSQRRGRVGQLIQRQQRLRQQLVADPLLDLATVRSVLGCSYDKLNRLLATGAIPYWQPVKFSERKVRQSALTAYLLGEAKNTRSGSAPPDFSR
jgi:hypothetical protein